jgi:hypothetical protein
VAARAAGVGISPGSLGGDGDPSEIEGGLDRFDIGAAGFGCPADAAEQVELIADVEPGIEGDVRATGPWIGEARPRREVRRGQAAGADFAQDGPCLSEVGRGDAKVGIGGERLLDEAIEDRVGEQAPPAPGRLVAGKGRRTRAHELTLRRRRRCRRRIVWSDRGAGGEGKRAGRGEQFSERHHLSPSNKKGSRAVPP